MKERYIVELILENPKDITKQVEAILTFDFSCNETDYGNGYHVSIKSYTEINRIIDLRYDRNFHPTNKVPWIVKWLYDTWSGKKGSWSIKEFTIK